MVGLAAAPAGDIDRLSLVITALLVTSTLITWAFADAAAAGAARDSFLCCVYPFVRSFR